MQPTSSGGVAMSSSTRGIMTGDSSAGLNPMSFTDQHGNLVLDRLRQQRDSGRFCDVSLVVSNRQFSAHRNVLAGCSPYFDSILKNNKVVKEQVTVNCQNPNVFELLLNYMYTGSVVIDRGCVTELLKLANNFLVTKLKNYCAEYLDRYLDAVNCLAVKELAAKYNMPGLLKNACDFLETNINRCLLESSDILDYSLSQVKNFLADQNLRCRIAADVHLKFMVRWVSHNQLQREGQFKQLLSVTPVVRVSQPAFETLLDMHPLLINSEQCRLTLLQCMYENNIPLHKYEGQYRALVAKFHGDVNDYYNNTSMNSMLFNNHHDVHQPPPQLEMVNGIGEASTSAFGSYEHRINGGIDSNNENNAHLLQPEMNYRYEQYNEEAGESPLTIQNDLSTNCAVAHDKQFGTVQVARPGLKMTLRLPILMNRKHRLLGKSTLNPGRHKMYRKTVSSALQKRRGRPPKLRPRPRYHVTDEDELLYPDCGIEQLDESAIIFEDEEEMDPSLIDDDAAEEDDEDNTLEDDSISQMVFRCPHCIYTANSQTRISSHITRAHSRNVIYVCSMCPFECKWNRQYYAHMKTHFEGPPFQCEMCEYSAERIQMLLTHRMKHTNERPFKCTQCDYRCRTKTNLIAHLRSHTGEKPYGCHECGRGFAIKSTLDQHLATHSDSRPYQCDECDFSTKYQSHLISHKRIHTGDVFHCQYADCSYSSPKKSQLAAHLRTHLAVRSHQCGICNRSFIEKSHLVRHERIHLADKPFKCECDNCDYASSRRDKLKEHILKHHSQVTNNKQHRRRYRRAKQLAQLAAQAKVLPDPATTHFRPINAASGGGADSLESCCLESSSTIHMETMAPPPLAARPVVQQQHQHTANVDFTNLMSSLNRPSSVTLPPASTISLSPSLSLNLNLGFGCDTPTLFDGMRKDVVLGATVAPTPVPNELVTPHPQTPRSVDFMAHTPPGDMPRPMSLPSLSGNQPSSPPWYRY